MAYIGAEPLPGQNREVDDISSSFNGSTTAFTLQVNGLNVSPETANNILVNIGGVIQNPGTDYTIAASTITFTTAPASGLSFFAIILGAGINTATVADDTIGPSKLIDTAVTAGSYTTADITIDAQGRITAAANGTIAEAEIANNAVTTNKIADQAVTLSKLPHGTSSNNGKFLRANNGADPTFETVSSVGGATGVDFNDNVKARFGTGNDLEIFHNGSQSKIIDTQGNELRLNADTIRFRDKDDGDTYANFIHDGAVELYHDNSKKFETESFGATLTGNLDVTSGDVKLLADNKSIQFGASADLKVLYTGSESRIDFSATAHNLKIMGSGGSSIIDLQPRSGHSSVLARANGAAELYHDNSKKLATISTGIEVHGSTDNARIQFHDAYSNTQIGYFGLNRFGIDGHDGMEVRDSSDSFRTIFKLDHLGKLEAFGVRPNAIAQLFQNTSSSSPEGILIQFPQAAPNTASRHFLKCNDNVGDKMVIDTNGNLRNLNASYGGFSDISLKENIIDASSQWDDIKNIKVRVFNFKSETASDKRIGVVAQEIETVCPKLVGITYNKDEDGNLLETGLKSVKYSILYMKAIKALQEAQTRIETLETKVAALEAA